MVAGGPVVVQAVFRCCRCALFPSWGLLTFVSGLLGPPGPYFGPPGAHFGPPAARFGPPRAHFGPPGAHFKPPGARLGLPGLILALPGGLLGLSWGPPGASLGGLGAPSGLKLDFGPILGAILDRFGSPKGFKKHQKVPYCRQKTWFLQNLRGARKRPKKGSQDAPPPGPKPEVYFTPPARSPSALPLIHRIANSTQLQSG